ncbi:MAG TPA: hypothetical protein VFV14_05075 [Myxococcaceae bacterium]|nr:hypothetical protein [Myxococcaceae bacterium]
MTPRAVALAVGATILLVAPTGWAQERPREDELFGAPDAGSNQTAVPPPPTRPSESEMFGGSALDGGTASPAPEQGPAAESATQDERGLASSVSKDLFTTEPTRENPLQIGGQIYLRSLVQATENTSVADTRFLLPAIVDGFFDARPSERVRGMILARLTYDPTIGPNAAGNAFGVPTTSNPAVLLDQLWVNFDVLHTVFVTAGRQHVKWGVSRFWNPTDYLSPQRRDPLAVFDPRLGASMLKLHLPSEHGWNVYAFALFDNAGPANRLGQIGGALRGEIAVGRGEVGAEMVLQNGRRPRFGLDASSAVGPLDLYLEVGMRKGSEVTQFRLNPQPDPLLGLAGQFVSYQPTDLAVGASGGFNTTLVFGENNDLIVGAEYFYNSSGYDSAAYYPWLILQGAFQPFYVGEHYGAIYATFTSPSLLGENTSLVLSNLANLSDQSLITRLDYLTRVLSYLFVEAFADLHYGKRGGEFRLGGFDLPIGDQTISVPAPTFDLGLGVRVKM